MAKEYSPVEIGIERGDITTYKKTDADGKVLYQAVINHPLFRINERMTSESNSTLTIFIDEAAYQKIPVVC